MCLSFLIYLGDPRRSSFFWLRSTCELTLLGLSYRPCLLGRATHVGSMLEYSPPDENPNEDPGPCWQNIFFSRLHTHWQSAQWISSNTDNSYDTVFVLDKTKPSCDQMSFDITYRRIQVLYEFFNMTTKEISWIRLLLAKCACLLWVLKCFFNAFVRLKTFGHSLHMFTLCSYLTF